MLKKSGKQGNVTIKGTVVEKGRDFVIAADQQEALKLIARNQQVMKVGEERCGLLAMKMWVTDHKCLATKYTKAMKVKGASGPLAKYDGRTPLSQMK